MDPVPFAQLGRSCLLGTAEGSREQRLWKGTAAPALESPNAFLYHEEISLIDYNSPTHSQAGVSSCYEAGDFRLSHFIGRRS